MKAIWGGLAQIDYQIGRATSSARLPCPPLGVVSELFNDACAAGRGKPANRSSLLQPWKTFIAAERSTLTFRWQNLPMKLDSQISLTWGGPSAAALVFRPRTSTK